jgi:hypothetical protein
LLRSRSASAATGSATAVAVNFTGTYASLGCTGDCGDATIRGPAPAGPGANSGNTVPTISARRPSS